MPEVLLSINYNSGDNIDKNDFNNNDEIHLNSKILKRLEENKNNQYYSDDDKPIIVVSIMGELSHNVEIELCKELNILPISSVIDKDKDNNNNNNNNNANIYIDEIPMANFNNNNNNNNNNSKSNDAESIFILRCDKSFSTNNNSNNKKNNENMQVKAKIWTILSMLSSHVIFGLSNNNHHPVKEKCNDFAWLLSILNEKILQKDCTNLKQMQFLPNISFLNSFQQLDSNNDDNDNNNCLLDTKHNFFNIQQHISTNNNNNHNFSTKIKNIIMNGKPKLFGEKVLLNSNRNSEGNNNNISNTNKIDLVVKGENNKEYKVVEEEEEEEEVNKKNQIYAKKWNILLTHFIQVMNNSGKITFGGIRNTLIVADAISSFNASMEDMEGYLYRHRDNNSNHKYHNNNSSGPIIASQNIEEEESKNISVFAKQIAGLDPKKLNYSKETKIPFFFKQINREQMKCILRYLQPHLKTEAGLDTYMMDALEEVFYTSQCSWLHKFSKIFSQECDEIGDSLFTDALLQNDFEDSKNFNGKTKLSETSDGIFEITDLFIRDFQDQFSHLGFIGEKVCYQFANRNIRESLEVPIRAAESYYIKKLENEREKRKRAEKGMAKMKRELETLQTAVDREGSEESLVIMAKLEDEVNSSRHTITKLKNELNHTELRAMEAIQGQADAERKLSENKQLRQRIKKLKNLAKLSANDDNFVDAEDELDDQEIEKELNNENIVAAENKILKEKIVSSFYKADGNSSSNELNTGDDFWSWMEPNENISLNSRTDDPITPERREKIAQKTVLMESMGKSMMGKRQSKVEMVSIPATEADDLRSKVKDQETEIHKLKSKFDLLKQAQKFSQKNNTITDFIMRKTFATYNNGDDASSHHNSFMEGVNDMDSIGAKNNAYKSDNNDLNKELFVTENLLLSDEDKGIIVGLRAEIIEADKSNTRLNKQVQKLEDVIEDMKDKMKNMKITSKSAGKSLNRIIENNSKGTPIVDKAKSEMKFSISHLLAACAFCCMMMMISFHSVLTNHFQIKDTGF